MALHILESFNTYATKDDLGIKWAAADDLWTRTVLLTTGGRYGGGCLQADTVYPGLINYTPPAARPLDATGIVGQALYLSLDWRPAGKIIDLLATNDADPASPVVSVLWVNLVATTNQLDVYSRTPTGTVLVQRTGNSLQPGRWNYIEFKGALTGAYTLMVNGEQWATGTANLTGQTLSATLVSVGVGVPGAMGLIDDIYICDGSGATANDFLGDITVKVSYPVADTAQKDFARSEGAYNYATIDEQQMSTLDYNYASTVNNKDLFEMGDLNIVGSILGVQLIAVARKSGSATRAIRSILKPNAAESEGPDQYLTQDIPNGSIAVYAINPETSAPWTPAEINALKCGYRVSV